MSTPPPAEPSPAAAAWPRSRLRLYIALEAFAVALGYVVAVLWDGLPTTPSRWALVVAGAVAVAIPLGIKSRRELRQEAVARGTSAVRALNQAEGFVLADQLRVAERIDHLVGDHRRIPLAEQGIDAELGVLEVEIADGSTLGHHRECLQGVAGLRNQDDEGAVIVERIRLHGSAQHRRLAGLLTSDQPKAVGLVLREDPDGPLIVAHQPVPLRPAELGRGG